MLRNFIKRLFCKHDVEYVPNTVSPIFRCFGFQTEESLVHLYRCKKCGKTFGVYFEDDKDFDFNHGRGNQRKLPLYRYVFQKPNNGNK